MDALVDTNVLLDIATEDPVWYGWSSRILAKYGDDYELVINPVIRAELRFGFQKKEDLETALPKSAFHCRPLPLAALALAEKCFEIYRRAGGKNPDPLPDFFIGAHASIARIPLITRDPVRYRAYFKKIDLVSPDVVPTVE